MPISLEWPRSPALLTRLRAIEKAASEGGTATSRVKGDIRKIVEEDHVDKMLRGVDRYGRPRAPLAPSTLADPRRGPGPSLIPRGLASRYITTFQTNWVTADDATRVLRMYFRDFTSRRGFPIPLAHEAGTLHLPARPVGGITPQGWAQIVVRHAQYAQQVLAGV